MCFQKRLLIKSLCILLCLLSFNAFSKELAKVSVFDLTLGEPFNIRECKYELVEQGMIVEGIAIKKSIRGLFGKPANILKMYHYVESKPSTDKCFQRVGPFYTSSPMPDAELPPVTPPNNQKVKLMYADSLRPAIADSEDIWVGIQNSKLTGLRFYFKSKNEQIVFNSLLKKYGESASKNQLTIQTPLGELKNFYTAKWSFPKFQVTFLSLDTNQIGYDPQDAPIGYLSEVGSVTIQYQIKETTKTDNNPL